MIRRAFARRPEPQPSTVTVTLTADTSRFETAAADVAESLRRQRYAARLARERLHARLFMHDLADRAWERYGLLPGGEPLEVNS